MAALTTLFPVFFMIGLGAIARIKNWITPEQKDGAARQGIAGIYCTVCGERIKIAPGDFPQKGT